MVETEEQIKIELLKERSEVALEKIKKNNEKQPFMMGCVEGAIIGVQIEKDMDNVIKTRVVDGLNQQP